MRSARLATAEENAPAAREDVHQPIDAVIFHALPGLGGKGTAVAISPEGAIDRGRVVQILVPSGLGRGLWLDGRMGVE